MHKDCGQINSVDIVGKLCRLCRRCARVMVQTTGGEPSAITAATTSEQRRSVRRSVQHDDNEPDQNAASKQELVTIETH